MGRATFRAVLAAGVLVAGLLAAAAAATGDPDASAGPSSSPSAGPAISAALGRVAHLTYEVVSQRPHDVAAYTEGLVLDEHGRLYESAGLVGQSSLREVDPLTGRVLRSVPPPGAQFDEGIALVDDHLIQLTWKDGLAFVWAADTFALLGTFAYPGEGWGLCYDGSRLVMSDGTPTLTFRDPDTFAVLGSVDVTLEGRPLARLNELECVDGRVWANVWETSNIVRIDPATGAVDGVLDASGLLDPDPSEADLEAVLNGIAWDSVKSTFLLTGKRWPALFEVRVSEG